MKVVMQVLVVFGSLGVFLYGIRLMSEGLQTAAGSRLRRILAFMTSNCFAGVTSGFAVTALIQSSSATTVMVVGFVDAALLTLREAIGVIMGANIGTTVTGWIVALFGFKFSISAAALPAIAVGTAIMLIKRFDREDIGEVFLGFGLLFLGLSLLKDSVPDIRNNPEVLEFLSVLTGHGFASFLLFVFVGTVLTIIVQSSSAAMAITLTMTFSGWIDYPTAAAIVLGENIGTTVTAYLASLTAGTNAKRAARAHMVFNLFGVLWMAAVFQPFLSLVDRLVPGAVTGRVEITAHLAMFHTLFNITNTAICIGFVSQFEKLVLMLVKEKEKPLPESYSFSYFRTGLQETVELNVIKAQAELGKMAAVVEELFLSFLEMFREAKQQSRARRAEIESQRRLTIRMQEEITRFLVECSREAISEAMARNVNSMIRIATELESIADTSNKLVLRAYRRVDEDIELGDELVQDIVPYTDMVKRFLDFNKQHLQNRLTEEEYKRASEMEDYINRYQKELKDASQKRIRGEESARAELFYIDILRHIEHIGDYSIAISRALTEIKWP